MKKFNFKHYIRKSHRYLGIFIGIQFLFWTIGGLYFSWTNIKEIRGEHLRQTSEAINTNGEFISPQPVLNQLTEKGSFELKKLQIIQVLNNPYYEIIVSQNEKDETILVDAFSGKIRLPISEQEASEIASASLVNPAAVKAVLLLTSENVNGHHEYRGKTLPAWAVTFDTPENLTVYLSPQNGQIGSFRTDKWRVFDFLWMLHTMDYENRDDFNNFLLRAFSVLGIATIMSGFILFFVSSKFFRRLLQR